MRRIDRGGVPRALALAFTLTPLIAFFALTVFAPSSDRTIMVPVRHFYIVSAASLVALGLAILVGIASVRTREPRTFLVAAAFMAVAGVFAVHGLTTPGENMLVKEMHHSIVISARLSLFIGSLLFLLSSVRPPRAVSGFISAHFGSLMIAVIAITTIYIGANLAKPDLLDFIPTGTAPRNASPAATANSTTTDAPGQNSGYSTYTPSTTPPVSPDTALSPAEQVGRALGYGMAIFAIVAYLLAAWRYFETYEITRTPATGALTVGLILLAEAQMIMALGETWHISWWLYHIAMLLGFAIPVAAIGLAYRRGSSLTRIVDGFFVRDAFARVERSFPEAINALIGVIEKKDPYLRGHMRRVGELTVQIAQEMNLPASVARAASHAALLHDLGKLGIPEGILHKPGQLTDDEFEVLKVHPERGYHMVMQSPALHPAAAAIRWHHERLDGSGYPDRIRGHEIPVEARIVAVADVWDALTSDRAYRKAMPPGMARDIIHAEANVKLDADCVQALFRVLDRSADPPVSIVRRPSRPSERPLPSFLAS